MPASRDKSQKIAFVYSNLYQLYKKGKEEASKADISSLSSGAKDILDDRKSNTRSAERSLTSSHIARVADLKNGIKIRTFQPEPVEIRNYEPVEFLQKRVIGVETKPVEQSSVSSVVHLHQKSIDELHALAQKTDPSVDGLKKNLKELTELHDRLRFMLGELEDLVKPKK